MISPTDQTLLAARDLSFSTDSGRVLFQKLNFSLEAGQILWVQGANGSGKTTLVRLLVGTQVADSGDIDCRVEPEEIGFVPQLQNVDFHLPLTFLDILDVEVGSRAAAEQADCLGLLDKRHLSLFWNTASGGERQRLLLTVALMKQPRLLILDEPFNHLDEMSQRRISQSLVDYLRKDFPKAMVVVSHQPLRAIEECGIPIQKVALGNPQ